MRVRTLAVPFLLICVPLACSAGGGTGKTFPGIGAGSTGNGTGSTTGAGSTVGAGSTFGTGGIILGAGSTPGTGSTGNTDGCQRIVSQPETITQTTYSPIAIYIMQDRSGSMVTGFPTGSAQSWGYATTAITQFVNDPASAGISVGLGAFPPYPSNAANNCTTDCNTPVVSIAPLPGNAGNIANAYNTLTPGALNFTPTECGLNGIAAACNAFEATSPGMPCVGLLITDGQPDACSGDVNVLSGILSTAATQGIKTFVIAMNGVTDVGFLNTLAQAGGTTSAIDLTQSNSSTAIVDALNTVRQKSTTSTTTQLPCEWAISGTIDPGATNLEFTPDTNAPVQQFGHTTDLGSCANVAGDAWYYDVNPPGTPTKVLVCPSTCDKIKAAPKPTVSLIFGCQTVEAPPR